MVEIFELQISDLNEVLQLWRNTEGIGLREMDSYEALCRYLERNPGLSFVARDSHRLLGAVLSGHDGRNGYLHHLAVDSSVFGQGIGRQLVEKCLLALEKAGFSRCHIFVKIENEKARSFWSHLGWNARTDILMYTQILKNRTE